jgi:NAD(P)-dependent dehydrogenase (short-subunit alcohol dehydrogenase family)
MTRPLHGKRALVTGASGAFGSAIARRLAADGAHLLLHGHSRPEAVQALADGDHGTGRQRRMHACSTSPATAPPPRPWRSLLAGGPVQIVVNNAGIHDDAVFPGMKPAQWHQVIDVSLHGFFRVTQPLTLPMLRTRWGRIINVSHRWPRWPATRARSTTQRPRARSTAPPRRWPGTGQPRRHRQRHRAGHHRFADGGHGFRCRDHQAPGTGAACRALRKKWRRWPASWPAPMRDTSRAR